MRGARSCVVMGKRKGHRPNRGSCSSGGNENRRGKTVVKKRILRGLRVCTGVVFPRVMC